MDSILFSSACALSSTIELRLFSCAVAQPLEHLQKAPKNFTAPKSLPTDNLDDGDHAHGHLQCSQHTTDNHSQPV